MTYGGRKRECGRLRQGRKEGRKKLPLFYISSSSSSSVMVKGEICKKEERKKQNREISQML